MLLKLSRFFLYASVFAVVIVMTSTFFPFIGGKDYFWRATVELALVFFFLYWGFEAKGDEVLKHLKAVSKKPLFIAVSVFVFAVLLASLFAHDPHAGFWSNFERGEGGFQMLHYYAFFVLLTALFRTREDWKRLFIVSLVAGLAMIAYGFFAILSVQYPGLFCSKTASGGYGSCFVFVTPYQGYQTPPSGFWALLTTERFQGSLGNPAYVAPYLLFSLFYVLYLWFESKNKKNWKTIVGSCVLIAIFLLFFILSQTRGAFLGLGVSIAAFFIYLIYSQPKLRKIGSIILGILIVLFILAVQFKDNPLVRKLPGSRVLDISLNDASAQTRLWTWGSAWKGFLERPILGWGPENFSTVFDKYFDPRHFIPGVNTETWFDRAHSVFLDYLAETGILGLASYLAIFVIIFLEFFRRHKRGVKKEGISSSLAPGLMLALPVAYLVQGIAIFDVLPMYINLFLFFAFSCFYFYES